MNFLRYDSILEIGCGDGYLLRELKKMGGRGLAGLEPSLPSDSCRNGIRLIKGFASEGVRLPRRYEFLFSAYVMEHVENIRGFMRFCLANLKPDGEMYFIVPNALKAMKDGDLSLFTHQHIQYFMPSTVRRLMESYGFEVLSLREIADDVEVLGRWTGRLVGKLPIAGKFGYEARLRKVMKRALRVLRRPPVIVHGISNSLNNLLGWQSGSFDMALVDNDPTKEGKVFFGKTAVPTAKISLAGYRGVLIIPNTYAAAIRHEYEVRSFQGVISDLILEDHEG
ncbi:MAG: methyltransferase domain-containing protein [Candidatus Omnitrophica bacterium]|nr:methyltransferase domain-containing protein [Candidatus Omnitrophota bacterium]